MLARFPFQGSTKWTKRAVKRLANGLRKSDNDDNPYKRLFHLSFYSKSSFVLVRAVKSVEVRARPIKMQCLNTKIKEEDIAGDAYVNESSSHLSAVAQQNVILSPRIEIHRIVKNHSPAMNQSAQNENGNAASRDDEITYERNTSPANITDAAEGPLCGADRMQQIPPSPQHQFVSPASNCAVLHYREHRTETTSMAMPQQRVHVIKDGRFYSTTTTTASTSSLSSNGTASATTTGATAAATGSTATSKNRVID